MLGKHEWLVVYVTSNTEDTHICGMYLIDDTDINTKLFLTSLVFKFVYSNDDAFCSKLTQNAEQLLKFLFLIEINDIFTYKNLDLCYQVNRHRNTLSNWQFSHRWYDA